MDSPISSGSGAPLEWEEQVAKHKVKSVKCTNVLEIQRFASRKYCYSPSLTKVFLFESTEKK
jgi:hypothetical protein